MGAGERATGGGAGFQGSLGDAVVQRTYPVNANGQAAAAGDVPEGWWAIVANNDASHALVPEVWVICARP